MRWRRRGRGRIHRRKRSSARFAPFQSRKTERLSYGRRLGFEPLEERRLLSITVNTLVDENDGIGVGGVSLRDAIAAAAISDTIIFAPALTAGGPAKIVLTHGEISINKSLTISGPGASLLTIDASGNDPTPNLKVGDGSRNFLIDDGNLAHKATVVIDNLTLTGGDANGDGGAIHSLEDLTISASRISGNAASADGGAISIYKNLLILSDTVV